MVAARRGVHYLEKKGRAAYTRAMRRPLALAARLLVVALIGGGAIALWRGDPAGPVYTVAEVTAGLRQHPVQWVGRTVAVRGVAIALYKVGSTGTGQAPASSWWSLMLDAFPPARHHRLAPPISHVRAVGQVQFNAPGTVPTLLVRGTSPPGSTLLDRARQLVERIAAHLGPARRTTTYSLSWPQPRLYRVQLLAPARCPALVAPPCYTAVVR